MQLLYRSVARDEEFAESDLDILLTALKNNGPKGISGFLWRARGQFFQALHGPKEAVAPLMERIARDERHSGVEILLRESRDPQSPFADWSMGYDYIAEDSLGLGMDPNGARPVIDEAKARQIWEAMVEQARSQDEWGTHFPYARKRQESLDAWKERLEMVRQV
ncbi:BLUF domain-containing protein [Vannielia sp.]|uniref:BLUF domain-containing protein n=1 Tax=Vannielia sp. TaxID=2813045 RepID=UPI002606B6C0|nr:BLUF domain-containing protein [Vannielia sp.]MDF1873522.1 BLUF domain-containing protein [Vannielia sp.]